MGPFDNPNIWMSLAGGPAPMTPAEQQQAQMLAQAQQQAAAEEEQIYLNNAKIAQSQQGGGAPISLYNGQTDANEDTSNWLAQLQNAVPEEAPVAAQQPAPQAPGGGGGYNSAFNDYMSGLREAQGLQKEGISDLQSQILALQNAPVRQDGLQRAVIMAADMWGGGAGKYSQAYNEANPNLDPKQRQAAITQLQDTLRKSRGDLSDSQIAMLKARLGFEESKLKADKEAGVQLPAGQAAELADLDTVNSQVANMEKTWIDTFGKNRKGSDDSSITDKLASYVPGTDANVFEARRKQWAQTIGVPLEGGKLTDPDYQRYLDNFIPGPFDSPDRARAKIRNLRKYATEKKAQRLKSFGQAGYKVSNMSGNQSSGIDPKLAAELKKRGL